MSKRLIIPLILISLLFACNSSTKEKTTKSKKTNYNVGYISQDSLFNRHIIYSSSDKGQTWNPSINNGLPNDTEASYFEKKDNEIVLGTKNKGLFITENNRATWKDIGKTLPTKKINAVHVSGEEIYVGLYDNGLFVTEDNGDSWQSLNESLPNLRVQGILKIKDEIIVGTDVGIYKTKHNIINWKPRHDGLQILSLQKVGNHIIAGTSNGVLLSNNSGESWNTIHDEGAIHFTAVVDQNIFALYMSGAVFMSEDMGETWFEFDYMPRKAAYVYELTGMNDYLIMNNSYGVFQSKDLGKSWKPVFNEERFVFFDFVVFDSIIYGGTRPSDEFRNRK